MLLQVEMIMVTLMLVAAVRAVPEFDPHKALTWLLGGGFIAILAGSVYLWVVMTARARRRSVPGQSGESEDAGLLKGMTRTPRGNRRPDASAYPALGRRRLR